MGCKPLGSGEYNWTLPLPELASHGRVVTMAVDTTWGNHLFVSWTVDGQVPDYWVNLVEAHIPMTFILV